MSDSTKASESATSKSEPCQACGGRKVVAFATEDVKCSACNGTGKQSSAEK